MNARNGYVVLAGSVVVMLVSFPESIAAPEQAVDKGYVTAVRDSATKVFDAVESLQDDIVEELAGDKEKTLYRLAGQVLSELSALDKAAAGKNPSREDLNKRFDRLDGKVTALLKAISDVSAKHPVLQRRADRVRNLNDGLHFVLSAGDNSKERQRQVLVRQAKALNDASRQLSHAAQYAVGEKPGQGRFLDDVKKLAQLCETFEKSTAGAADLEQCKKEFSTITEVWRRVAEGFRLLPANEDVYLARVAFRVDAVHFRLFQALGVTGDCPRLTINL